MTAQSLARTNTRFIGMLATVLLSAIPSISNADTWELRTTPIAVPGTAEIESGKIDKAVRLSIAWLPHVTDRKEVAVLSNLCIAHILKKEFERAEDYCEQAVTTGDDEVVSYNNRGILRAMQGDFDGAAEDFTVATEKGCNDGCSEVVFKDLKRPGAVAMRNRGRAEMLAQAAIEADKNQVAANKD